MGENIETHIWHDSDVMDLLLWGAHNYSACICSHNKFIAVRLDYEINMTDSYLFFYP